MGWTRQAVVTFYARWIHRWERHLTMGDRNRRIFPFEWGLDWLAKPSLNGVPPHEFLPQWSHRAVMKSADFFNPPEMSNVSQRGDRLSFATPTPGKVEANNTASGRLFQSSRSDSAVVVIPQWNADGSSHVGLCRILQRLGVTAVRLTLPFHEERRPAGMQRADFMVSPNLGRTIYATRQAVLEVRQLGGWLRRQGFRRIGIMGTSIGSCVGYLAFTHDRTFSTGVFNHVSSHFADVVWNGLSTRYVRWGLDGFINLDRLRACWAPLSPIHFIARLENAFRPHLMISAKYDLTFPPELSQKVFERYKELGIPLESVILPCGHYTTARFPFKWVDGWHICSYLRRRLQESDPGSKEVD